MKLMVRKGDPDKLTDAEIFIQARDKKRALDSDSRSKAAKRKLTGAQALVTGMIPKYDRIHKLATDIDFFSLGNRMFSCAKKLHELFHDKVDLNKDVRSLAARIQATPEEQEARFVDVIVGLEAIAIVVAMLIRYWF